MTTEELDLKCWPIFHKMTQRGLQVSPEKLANLHAEVSAELETQLWVARTLTGLEDFNPMASAQVAAWMESQGMTGKKTKGKGQMATDERSLAAHKDNPVIAAVLASRGASKLLGTFIEPIQVKIAETGGTVHPRWRLTKVRSGRVSTEDPNLLAFPSRDELGKKVRGCFVARPGHHLVSVDFSQLEPRIVAELSQDPKLMEVYERNLDLYTQIAVELGIERQVAKIVTLGVLYGMGAARLVEQLAMVGVTMTVDEAQGLIDAWFTAFAGVKRLIQKIVSEAKATGGWVYTHGGRGRLLPGLYVNGWGWPASKIREEAERQAFNHVIQGTGMEQLKLAMIELDNKNGMWHTIHMLLAIHDELVFEVKTDGNKRTAEIMAKWIAEHHLAATMRRMFGKTALKTNYKVGLDWGEIK